MLVSNLFYLSTSHFEKYGEITDLYMPKVCSLSLTQIYIAMIALVVINKM